MVWRRSDKQVSPRVGTEELPRNRFPRNVLETRDAARAAARFSGRKRQHPYPDAFADPLSPVVLLADAH